MDGRISRRRVVRASGVAALAALAGCGGDGSNGTETTGDATEAPGGGETAAETVGTETGAAETGTAETETGAAETETETETAETETETAADESTTPHGSLHAHGSMVVEINGETYTLADEPRNHESNTGDPNFHFHEGSDQYHLHAEGVTLDYALDSLPQVEASAETFEFRGHTYDANDADTRVRYVAGGDAVGLNYTIPESAPALRVVVETDAATPTPETATTTASS